MGKLNKILFLGLVLFLGSLSVQASVPAVMGTIASSDVSAGGGGGGGGDGCTPMGSVVSSAVFDLDATCNDSYGGSGQTWANIETTPADSASQTDYDFYLGADGTATTDDPTFTGSAGDNGAYFALDGGDHFFIKTGSNTTFLANLPKTTGGSDHTFVFVVQPAVSGTTYTGSTSSTTTTQGVNWGWTSAESVRIFQRGDDGNSIDASGDIVSGGTDQIIIYSHSDSTDETKVWLNTTTATTYSQTYNTTTTAATQPMVLAAFGSGPSNQLFSGTRVYAVSMFNEYFDDTKAAAVFSEYETRHGRDYTP